MPPCPARSDWSVARPKVPAPWLAYACYTTAQPPPARIGAGTVELHRRNRIANFRLVYLIVDGRSVFVGLRQGEQHIIISI